MYNYRTEITTIVQRNNKLLYQQRPNKFYTTPDTSPILTFKPNAPYTQNNYPIKIYNCKHYIAINKLHPVHSLTTSTL